MKNSPFLSPTANGCEKPKRARVPQPSRSSPPGPMMSLAALPGRAAWPWMVAASPPWASASLVTMLTTPYIALVP